MFILPKVTPILAAIFLEMTLVQPIRPDIIVSVGLGARLVPSRSMGSSMI